MKKTRIAMFICLLALLLATSALAQTTAVELDGETYTFFGGPGSYVVDGMTFVIEDGSVTVKRNGAEDLHLPLMEADGEAILIEGGSDFCGSAADEAVLSEEIAEGGAAGYMCEATVQISADAQGEDFDPADYAAYADFGLRVDAVAGALYYRGARVRIFEDALPIADAGVATLEHVDPDGAVDVRALRDKSGTITGLEALTEAEFAARDLNDWLQPKVELTATAEAGENLAGDGAAVSRAEITCEGGEPLSPEEMQDFYAQYAPFGLEYDAQAKALKYMGRAVRSFTDVRSSNGAAMSSGKFEGTLTHTYDEGGVVDVEAIRDYGKLNEDGEGKLVGMKVAPAA